MNGKPEPIVGFQAVDGAAAHVEVILMIDTVNTGFSTVAYELSEIERFLKQNQGRLAQPVSIAVLTDTGIKISPQPSTDGNELAAYLQKTKIPIADYHPFDGLLGLGRKISDFRIGPPQPVYRAAESSRPQTFNLGVARLASPVWGGGRTDRKRGGDAFFNNLVTISAAMREARITLYSVDPLGTQDADRYPTMFYKSFTKGVRSPRNMQIGNLALQVLALDTGGRIFNSSNGISSEIAQAVEDADAFYTITVDPPPASHPNEYRAISVTVDQGGATARTLTGYYAQP